MLAEVLYVQNVRSKQIDFFKKPANNMRVGGEFMLIKQPNGKLCICSYDGTVERMNLTEDEYTDYFLELAKEESKKNLLDVQHFGKLIEKQKVTDEQLKEMGSNQTLSELLKFVPRSPLHTQYIPINFETQGTCPNCGAFVVNGIGGTDKKCKCGQILRW